MVHKPVELIKGQMFEAQNHYYEKLLNAQVHPIVSFFFHLSKERIMSRFCHLNPHVDAKELAKVMGYKPKHFLWAGADLFHTTTATGTRRMVVIETNSCPSGQKSMPLLNEHKEMGGYEILIRESFIPALKQAKDLPKGGLCVLYDKNYMENKGYACALAEIMKEQVYLVPCFQSDDDPSYRFTDGVLEIRDESGAWLSMRAALRYVTQRPWARVPLKTKTFIYNGTLTCIAGGRNKMVAAKAYQLLNAELQGKGLKIHAPETIRDVSKEEIPLWVRKFKGCAVVKIPYSNAGQGVFTITNEQELANFMEKDYPYDQFIVQSLVGNSTWSSHVDKSRYYHMGTVPNKRQEIFATDLRMMVISTPDGFRPVAIYARRASKALATKLETNDDSWSMLGTNLSIKKGEDAWDTDMSRLMIVDKKDFNALGLGLDELIEAYVQTLLAVVAIDKMAINLVDEKSEFRSELFASLNNDPEFLSEVKVR